MVSGGAEVGSGAYDDETEAMIYDYDAESDSLYLRFRDCEYAESEEIYPAFVIDFDKDGKPLALDIDEASNFVDYRRCGRHVNAV